MERQKPDSIKDCNVLLANNAFLSNGKNFPLDYFYATSANSRWPYENLWGIFLTKPEFAWIALWTAITSRVKLKKRQIAYFRPQISRGDYIGSIGIFNPDQLSLEDVLCKTAYLYLFDPRRFKDFCEINTESSKGDDERVEILIASDFEWRDISRRGKNYRALANPSGEKFLVNADEWQVALVGVETLVPDVEVIIGTGLIQELAARIQWLKKEVGRNYIN